MSTTETKLDAIRATIDADIKTAEEKAGLAIKRLERFNITPEGYKEACIEFGAYRFISGYLERIRNKIWDRSIRYTENVVRFHAHQQRAKGGLDDGQDVSLAQAKIVAILEGYVEKFFEA